MEPIERQCLSDLWWAAVEAGDELKEKPVKIPGKDLEWNRSIARDSGIKDAKGKISKRDVKHRQMP